MSNEGFTTQNGKVFWEAVAERIDVAVKASPQRDLTDTRSDGPPPISDDDIPF